MFIPMIFYDFCLLPEQFYYIIVYIRNVKVSVKFTSRLAVYRESVQLGVKSFQTYEKRSFLQLNICGNSPSVTSSLMNVFGLSSSLYFSHMTCY
jgi:hypothetical protein